MPERDHLARVALQLMPGLLPPGYLGALCRDLHADGLSLCWIYADRRASRRPDRRHFVAAKSSDELGRLGAVLSGGGQARAIRISAGTDAGLPMKGRRYGSDFGHIVVGTRPDGGSGREASGAQTDGVAVIGPDEPEDRKTAIRASSPAIMTRAASRWTIDPDRDWARLANRSIARYP